MMRDASADFSTDVPTADDLASMDLYYWSDILRLYKLFGKQKILNNRTAELVITQWFIVGHCFSHAWCSLNVPVQTLGQVPWLLCIVTRTVWLINHCCYPTLPYWSHRFYLLYPSAFYYISIALFLWFWWHKEWANYLVRLTEWARKSKRVRQTDEWEKRNQGMI